jgi:hypothetical protein
MKKTLIVMLGVSLIAASILVLAYNSVTNNPPLLGSGSGQSTSFDYVNFFCIALGGAGILILSFAFLQWHTRDNNKGISV